MQIILSNFSLNDIPIIIIDEFDRIHNDECKILVSDTIKHLSDYAVNCTVVIVGVAESVIDLIAGHRSISRALTQVQMPRMTSEELREIVSKRINRTQLSISGDALWRIAFLSHGLPFYAHSLGKSSAIVSIEKHRYKITETVIDDAVSECINDVDQYLIDAYVKATVETRKGNIFRQVLAACSMAEQDDLGRFSAAQVEGPLSEIMRREMKTPSFSFHLNELCSKKRGKLLQKAGEKSHFRFRFIEPIMQPYITMKSLSDGIIDNQILDKFAIQRQKELSI